MWTVAMTQAQQRPREKSTLGMTRRDLLPGDKTRPRLENGSNSMRWTTNRSASRKGTALTPARIAIVDDDCSLLSALDCLLRSHGYSVSAHGSAEGFLA